MKEHVDCDLCGSAKKHEIVKQKDFIHKVTNEYFNLVKCEECSLVYVNPRPNTENIHNYYSNDYDFYKKNSFVKNQINLLINLIIKIKFFLRIIDLIPNNKIKKFIILRILPSIKYPFQFNQNTKFLDIGCGGGDSIHFWNDKFSVNNLHTKFKYIYAIEPSNMAFENIKLPNNQKKKNLGAFDDIKFDHIRMNWSLEHVHKPSDYFDYVSKNLAKNGKFLLCIPNYEGIIYKIDPASVEVPIHLYHFTISTIKKYCEKNNLKINYIKTFSYPGMYYFSSQINQKFSSFKNFSPSGAHGFLKQMEYFDNMGLGNDMLFVIEKIN